MLKKVIKQDRDAHKGVRSHMVYVGHMDVFIILIIFVFVSVTMLHGASGFSECGQNQKLIGSEHGFGTGHKLPSAHTWVNILGHFCHRHHRVLSRHLIV